MLFRVLLHPQILDRFEIFSTLLFFFYSNLEFQFISKTSPNLTENLLSKKIIVILLFHRGDVVISKSPSSPANFVCKRVAATVCIS